MEPEHIIYIAGVARSGTSWLGQLVNSSPLVRFRFQPLFSYEFKGRITEDSEAGEYSTFLNDLYTTETEFLVQNEKVRSGEYPNFGKADHQPFLAFKENRYQSVIEPMLRKVPRMKLLSIVRNPCAVLHSWSKNPKEFPPGSVLRDEWRFGNCKNKGNEDYFGYYKWKEVSNLYLDLQQQFPGRAMVINYQELVQNPESQTSAIFKFLGLPLLHQTTDFLNASTHNHNDSYYSVYKKPGSVDSWKKEFDPYIASEILHDLRGTRLEQFL
jgi:hypothetical protein